MTRDALRKTGWSKQGKMEKDKYCGGDIFIKRLKTQETFAHFKE
jgi:hypothetical protein